MLTINNELLNSCYPPLVDCLKNCLDGFWYRIYPVAREGDVGDAKTLHIGDNIGYACEGVSEVLTKIDFDGQTATFLKTISEPPVGGCPI